MSDAVPLLSGNCGFENSSYEIGKLPRFNGLWKSLVIIRKVKANYSKGVFIPQERLDLEEGKEVVVSVEEIASEDGALESLKEAAGGWIGMHDLEQLKRMIYEAQIREKWTVPFSDCGIL